VLVLSLWFAGGTLIAQGPKITSLLSRDLAGTPGKELSMITVDYPPGASDPAHTHHAQVMVYVLEGSVVMQVKGKSPVTLMPGQTFHEEPDDVHVVARNASHTASAKFLVFFVKDKGAPLLVPAK
jgi:quercetin dioxygenase-like cupin family protein